MQRRRATQAENLAQYGDTVRRLYVDEALSQSAIAAAIGVAQQTVGDWLRVLGIPVRPAARVGPKNGNYKNGTQSTLYRKLVVKTKCEMCPATKNLGVHHKDGDHYNNAVSNLQVLCGSCHSRLHKTAYWAARPRKTVCLRGHPLSGDNLYVNKRGHHSCKQCMRAKQAELYGPLKGRRRPTHCVHGHELTPENTYVDGKGHRSCVICRRAAAARSAARQAARRSSRP